MKPLKKTSSALVITTLISLTVSCQAFGQGGTWTLKAPIPTPRHDASTALAPDGKIYVSGGYNTTTIAVNEAYDPVTDSWMEKTPMPVARQPGDEGARIGSIIYVEDGEDFGNCSNSNLAYNTSTDTWLTLTGMLTARCSLAAVALNGLV
jgi:Kelch motif